MLHTPSNRGTPVSGENITKIIRQHYKPQSPQPYRHEQVQCRTNTNCQKGKPDDYWNVNFRRRQNNFDKGFYSSSTEPYRPIGGDLILDPYDLVLSALPGNTTNKKFQPRYTRRGTIYEPDGASSRKTVDDKGDLESSCDADDLVDNCPSAGFDDIKKLLRQSRDRIVCVKAGKTYEDHVKVIEEQSRVQEEAIRPVETGMVVHSISSVCMPIPVKDSRPPSQASTRSTRIRSPLKGYSQAERKVVSICENLAPHSPTGLRRSSRALSRTVSPNKMNTGFNKVSLLQQCSSGITNAILRKERQFRDHLAYLKSIFNILTALHNMKVKDIRSKIPLSREIVERIQKEGPCQRDDERSSRNTYAANRWPVRRIPDGGSRMSMHSMIRGSAWSRRGSVENEAMDSSQDPFAPKKTNLANNIFAMMKKNTVKNTVESDAMDSSHDPFAPKKTNLANNILAMMKKNTVSKFQAGKSSRMSTMDIDTEGEGGRMSVFGTFKRINAMDTIGKNFFGRRRSRNATALISDRPLMETWDDLLNYQPPEYKQSESPQLGFQVGIVTKFMKWIKRASIVPTHQGAGISTDNQQALKDMASGAASDRDKGERESTYRETHGHPGSAAAPTEKARKLPIWQQVAQEKSTVFHNKKAKAPNPDTTIQRFKRDLNKLKRSVQKENTAELEKLVRERVASFRLKFGALDQENCGFLFSEQIQRVQQVKENVNRSQLETFDVQPSKWYEELREKTLSLVSAFDQPAILEMIQKLQAHAHMDNKTVPYAKAKLCLLMMSLPAYDICQIYVQKALKFIFENILLGQEGQFDEWLSHRKLPYLVVND